MSSTKLEHVIIVGGGLGGLATALSFHYLFPRHNLTAPRITIYEREPTESSRINEGYTMAIRGDRVGGAVQALKTINQDLYNDIRSMAAPEGDKNVAMQFSFGVNCDLNPALKLNTSAGEDSFRIARFKLRNRLVKELKHFGESKIKLEWNSHVIKADYNKEKNKVNVELKDGRTNECDLLIVADGAHSSVRRYIYPEEKLNFQKCISLSCVTTIDDGESLPSPIRTSPLVGTTGKGIGMFMAAIDEKSFFWGVIYPSNEERPPPYKGSIMTKDEQEEFVNEVLTRTNGWLSNEFCSFVRKCDRERILILNSQDKFPHKNPSEKHVIFIGDALHPMNPTSGNGANMAIMDAVELIQLLIKHHVKQDNYLITRSIDEFDRDHVQRSTTAIKVSHRNMAFAVATGLKFQLNIIIMRIVAFAINNSFLFKSLLIGFVSVVIMILILYVRKFF
ncbi:unnamed protein product [Adineta steineri]|uniref:FAD-binding domain-containing protein n=1 Tax=Adineta steineri TaxID=433720 RepID=A0A815HRJ8_9BILA|nr:unnamed protein product [Adineta steineri]